jgi:uncharacterized protein (TIGR02246 family)
VSRIEDAVDRLELRELVERYALGADTRDREVFAAVFTDDGALVTAAGGTYVGPHAIVSTLDYLDAHYPRSMHFVGNHQVQLDGYSRDGEDRDTLMVIRYQDDYRRTADGWRIARRSLRIDWQEDRPLTVDPG